MESKLLRITACCGVQLLLALTLYTTPGFAQSYRNMLFEHITREDGLSNSEITSIAQDRKGFIWVGTTDGLNRYDGHRVMVYKNDPEDGQSLVDNHITALFADSDGHLWIGTKNKGLSKYSDTCDCFQNYSFDPVDPSTISFNYVTSFAEDQSGHIWVGTMMGLNRYVESEDHFERHLFYRKLKVTPQTLNELPKNSPFNTALTHLFEQLQDSGFIEEKHFTTYLEKVLEDQVDHYMESVISTVEIGNFGAPIKALEFDNIDQLWLGFEKAGIGVFQPGVGIISRLDAENSILNVAEVTHLYRDGGQLWVCTDEVEAFSVDFLTREVKRYRVPWATSSIKSIFRDRNNQLWIGNGEGLGLYDEQHEKFVQQSTIAQGSNGLLPGTINAILEDFQGNLWISSFQGGLNLLPNKRRFQHYSHFNQVEESLTKNPVSAILADKSNDLWIGYYTSGLDYFKDGYKKHFPYGDAPGQLGSGTLFAIFEDRAQDIWLGFHKGGLQKYLSESQTFQSFVHDEHEHSIAGNDVRAIAEDRQGNLWLALHGKGVDCLSKRNERFRHYQTVYPEIESSLASNWVHDVIVDSQGRVWAATVAGLSVLNPGATDFISYTESNSNISNAHVVTLFEDRDHRICAGTEYGLNLFIDSLQQFQVFTTNDGLSNNGIKKIAQDHHGDLWISTNNGLSQYMMASGKFKNYSRAHGLQADEFFLGAGATGMDGKLYFGGQNGLNVFSPDSLKETGYQPPLYLENFRLFSKTVAIGDETGILPRPLQSMEEIALEHDQNFFSISFLALDYLNNHSLDYRYLLEGFDRKWNYTDSQREAVYTKVPPGDYTFRVQVKNLEGQWQTEGISLKVAIRQPFWKTNIAYSLYLIVVVVMVWLIRKAVLNRIYIRHQMEMDQLKIKFFTNISHEFRTPLTLILGPLNDLLNNTRKKSAEELKLLQLMRRNGNQLMKLVNQLMEIYQIDAGFAKLKVSEENLSSFVNSVFESFTYKAAQKKLHFHLFNSIPQGVTGYIDRDKLEKILNNLISNAIKFTPSHGAVMVFAQVVEENTAKTDQNRYLKQSRCNSMIEISVEDSGFGIPKALHQKIFNRFYQLDHQALEETGSGIGLSLVNQLTEIHKGSIALESEIMEGTRFTVRIPVSRHNYQRIEFTQQSMDDHVAQTADCGEHLSRLKLKELPVAVNKPILLIIDDNEDIRKYMTYLLRSTFEIREAASGIEGVAMAKEEIPDLILSDIMMPGMNGIEMCKTLKQEPLTCHIPIILLTAKSSEEYHIEGLVEGADDYITKPFKPEILKIKLQNKVKQLNIYKKKFEASLPASREDLIHDKDQQLLSHIYAILDQHLSDTEFGPDQLAKEIGMSRSVLYRKINGLTGSSVSLLIRKYRITEAARMLTSEIIPVKEVAYKVGFKDPSYFTSCFKKVYNYSPSEFTEKAEVL